MRPPASTYSLRPWMEGTDSYARSVPAELDAPAKRISHRNNRRSIGGLTHQKLIVPVKVTTTSPVRILSLPAITPLPVAFRKRLVPPVMLYVPCSSRMASRLLVGVATSCPEYAPHNSEPSAAVSMRTPF